MLGLYYFDGQYIPKDTQLGIHWIEKAAASGHADAQQDIARTYTFGLDVPVDYLKAYFWNKKAAENGDAISQAIISNMYEDGNPLLQKNLELSFKWAELSSEDGYFDGMYNLGRHYLYGKGVPKNDVLAIKWLTLAKKYGSEDAIDLISDNTNSFAPGTLELAEEEIEDWIASHQYRIGYWKMKTSN